MKLLSLLVLLTSSLFAQTTYVQTTSKCGDTSCTNAQFTPTATLSYNVSIQTCGEGFHGVADWNGNQYLDFSGTYTFVGYDPYPYSKWLLQGTFANGTYTVSETFHAYRGCAPFKNLSGTVVGP